MKLLPAIALLLASSAATAAEAPAEYPSAVQTFLDVCVTGELSVAAREAALQAGGWTPVAEPTLDVPAFGISKAIEKNFNYSKPVSVREWTKSVDGAPVQAVLATFPADRRYPNLCALTFPDVKAAWPYRDAFDAGVKALGLKGKSTDLPHYFEYSGKLGADKKPARAEIFSRSQATGEKNSMHLYIAF
ncbi:MAG: hypothetical protein E6G94_08495 [Alphaproteobacteria bacterium]|nr:MAG: hypothetical protein E6G94_08495 [Alphaproteobacteria bacterium]